MVALLVPVLASSDSPSGGGFSEVRLRHALVRGSLVELEEIGTNLSERDLLSAIQSPDRELALAGIAAAAGAQDAWVVLPALAERASAPDRPIAAAAAEVAVGIARDLPLPGAPGSDVMDDELEAAADAWLAVAGRPGSWPDVRVRGLEVTAALARAQGRAAPGYELEGFADDAEPEVRRAAYELLPGIQPAHVRARAARAVVEEPVAEVALAAAQALCSTLEPRPVAWAPPAGPVLADLGAPGLSRIAALVADPELPPAGILAAARCLAADSSPDSRQALAELARTGPPAIRAHARALLEGMAP